MALAVPSNVELQIYQNEKNAKNPTGPKLYNSQPKDRYKYSPERSQKESDQQKK